jgi:hypothetical protein
MACAQSIHLLLLVSEILREMKSSDRLTIYRHLMASGNALRNHRWRVSLNILKLLLKHISPIRSNVSLAVQDAMSTILLLLWMDCNPGSSILDVFSVVITSLIASQKIRTFRKMFGSIPLMKEGDRALSNTRRLSPCSTLLTVVKVHCSRKK